MREKQQRMEDYFYRADETSGKDYLKILRARLVGLEQYSNDWISLKEQIADVEEKILDEQDRRYRNQYEVGNVSEAAYIKWLKRQLRELDKFSDEWMDIWRELEAFQEDAADRLETFGDSLEEAFKSTFGSFKDPIMEATSLLSAFGNEASVSLGQVEGFFEHMTEATTRWTGTVGQLKEAGLNSDFLRELITSGPSSLGLAESILGMGAGGIDFINSSLAAIDSIATGAGIDYASAQVGQAIQTQNNVTVNVGDIELNLETEGTTITMADVTAAIDQALSNVTSGIVNKTTGSVA
jgi:hypothetical protein